MNTALVGLSADPPTLAHLALARTLWQVGFQEVVMMITPQNPDKHDAMAPYYHRRELLRILMNGEKNRLNISDFEAGMTVLNENIRTFMLLTHLKRVFPEETFTFVVGADNWADPQTGLHTWGHFGELLDLASFLVMPRYPWTELVETCEATRVLKDRRRDFRSGAPMEPGTWALASVNPAEGISSTKAREDLGNTGESADLTPAQLTYIRAHGLYGLQG